MSRKYDGGPLNITPLQQVISSCSGATLTSLFVTPLDVVKIRLQAQSKPFIKGQCFLYCNGLMDHLCHCVNGAAAVKPWYKVPLPGHFHGTLDAFVKIARYEGVASLWSGLPPTLIMAVPATVVYYTSYDHIKYSMGYRENDPATKYVPVLAGSIARVGAATLISPIELVRTKMQSKQVTYGEVCVAARSAIQQGGFFSLMRGLGPTLLRDVPFSAMFWFGYEYIKAEFLKHDQFPTKEATFIHGFVAGAVSGTFAAVVTLPFDVIKTHRQIELGEALFAGKKQATSSTWSLISRLYRHNGVTALFAGMVPRLVKVTPACAIMVSTYEYGKTFFHNHNLNKHAYKVHRETAGSGWS